MGSGRQPASAVRWPWVWAITAGLVALIAILAFRILGHGQASLDGQDAEVTLSRSAPAGPRGPYLADIPGKPRAGTYFEGRRVVAGYAGHAARYRRCDGATLDVDFAPGSDNLDLAALEGWRVKAPCNAWARLTLVQVYDQDGRYPPLAATGGNADIEDRTEPSRDWQGRLASLNTAKRPSEVAFSGTDTAFSALVALQVMAGIERVSLWSLADSRGNEAALTLGGGIGPTYRSGAAASPEVDQRWLRDPAVAVRANPSVIGWTSSPEARSFFSRGAVATRTGNFRTTAMTRFRLGTGGPPAVAGWQRYGVILWQASLTPDEMQAAIARVNRAMAFPVSFEGMLVARGDSILYGSGSEGGDQRGPSWFLAKALPTVELFNLGMKAQQLGQQLGPDFAAGPGALLSTSPYGPSRTAMLWTSGTNDIGMGGGPPEQNMGRTAAQIIADSATATKLSRAALPGVKVLRTTLLPRADPTWIGTTSSDGMAKEQVRQAVNAAWAKGASGADLVIDLSGPGSLVGAAGAAADETAVSAPGIPMSDKLYVDRLHPSSVGYASGMMPAIEAALKQALGL